MLEQRILEVFGDQERYGFEIAQLLRDPGEQSNMAARGTVYKALRRLERMDLVTSRWEDTDRGPRRRLYRRHAAPGADEPKER